LNFLPRKKLFSARRRRRRNRFAFLAVLLLVLAVGAVYAFNYYASDGALLGEKEEPSGGEASPFERVLRADSGRTPEEELAPEIVPDAAKETPEGAAYWAVASELPGVSPESITGVYRSKLNPSWASVHIVPSGEKKVFVVFVQRVGEAWEARKSIRADEPDYAKNEVVPLADVPKDLVQYVYPENLFAADVPAPKKEKVDTDALPGVEPPEFAPPEPVTDGVPDSEREQVEQALGEARQKIEGYEGVAGVYVQDLEGGFGYGIRPDEQFFSASIIKIPVMVAVYRKVDEGELSFSQMVEIKEEDWAAGAGWLQWEKAGTKQTVGDLLLLMMTQSDNVATNALVRTVGGADHVNEVARSLGAENTLLYQKLSSERAAVPELDNRTTPRDMATMLQKIADGESASDKSCGYMIELMNLNELDWWLDAGLPYDVYAANKAGWLYEVYDDVGIVKAGDRPYVVAILSKYGTGDVDEGRILIEELSRAVWEAQNKEESPDSS
jgi:beta-lactamase class A